MTARTAARILSIPAAVALTAAFAQPALADAGPPASPKAVGLIVRYAEGVDVKDNQGRPAGGDRAAGQHLRAGEKLGFGLRTVTFDAPVSAETARDAARAYTRNSAVVSAEPDYVVSIDAGVSTNTVQSGATWGIDRIDQRTLPLSGTYTYQSTGAGVTAYVVDTGILTGHTQFAGRVLSGYSAISDGYGTTDRNGHGTHVSGTIAGSTYGVAKAVKLVPVRVLDAAGSGTTSGVIAGLNWIVSNHAAGVPAVANMSLGGGASDALDTAVNAVINDGVTMVVAAGNSTASSCTASPARVPNAITVNASTSTDARASYSNYGSCSDIYAPGSSITSAWHTSTTATNTISGTSMATPHVAGVAARLLSSNPTLTPAQVWSAINANSTAVNFGLSGQGDPNKLLFADPGAVTPLPPSAPTSVVTTRANSSASVSWKAPTSSGTSPVTGYTARAWSASSGGSTVSTCTAASTGCTITGLSNGVTYYVDVVATSSVGTGPASTPRVAVTPATAPTAPTSVTATSPKASTIKISWRAPASTGGASLTSYTARVWAASTGGTSPVKNCTAKATTLTCTVSSLSRATTYYVDVVAANAVGTGPASSPRVSVRTL